MYFLGYCVLRIFFLNTQQKPNDLDINGIFNTQVDQKMDLVQKHHFPHSHYSDICEKPVNRKISSRAFDRCQFQLKCINIGFVLDGLLLRVYPEFFCVLRFILIHNFALKMCVLEEKNLLIHKYKKTKNVLRQF